MIFFFGNPGEDMGKREPVGEEKPLIINLEIYSLQTQWASGGMVKIILSVYGILNTLEEDIKEFNYLKLRKKYSMSLA